MLGFWISHGILFISEVGVLLPFNTVIEKSFIFITVFLHDSSVVFIEGSEICSSNTKSADRFNIFQGEMKRSFAIRNG